MRLGPCPGWAIA